MPGGRPTSYRKEYANQAEKLCLLGATDDDLADFFNVSVRTIHRWKASNKEFCHSLKVGKDVADDLVERSLYQRAIGYSHDEDKVFIVNGEPMVVPTKKHYAPDTTAGIFWLKNRRKEEWRDKQEIENTHDVSDPMKELLGHVAENGKRIGEH